MAADTMKTALEHCIFKALPDCCPERPSLVPKECACVMGKYVCMMNAVHILLCVSIKSTVVVGKPCTSLDEVTFDCFSFVIQQC
jgi:hypothetical protein